MQIKELPSSSTLASNDVLVKETSGGTTQKITGADFAGQVKNIGSLLGTGDVVNNLNSSSSTAPLAAAQGKALNDAKGNASDIAIIIDGNQTTHTGGAAIGEFVLVRNSTISGISDGLYTAAQAIPANTVIDSTYLTAVDGGGLNAVLNFIGNLIKTSTISGTTDTYGNVLLDDYTISDYLIIGAFPDRTISTDMSFVAVSMNASGTKYMLHFVGSSGGSYSSKTVKATIIYIDK